MDKLELNRKFTRLAVEEQIDRTMQALEANGIRVFVVETGEEARECVLSLIPAGAQVYNPPSLTLDQIGLAEAIQSSQSFQSVRARLRTLDRATQQQEFRRLTSSPDVVVGSVQAITQQGQILVASATGSQLGSAASGAGAVIWVAGAQKLVPTFDEGLRRIREYCYPLEDQRTRQAYGQPSAVNKILVVNGELQGRITLILVKQPLGL
jgi:hypothetical protein